MCIASRIDFISKEGEYSPNKVMQWSRIHHDSIKLGSLGPRIFDVGQMDSIHY